MINDEIYDLDNTEKDYKRILNEVANMNFEDAVNMGNLAKNYIENNYEMIKENYDYSFRHDPLDVIKYLIQLWENGYYVTYSY